MYSSMMKGRTSDKVDTFKMVPSVNYDDTESVNAYLSMQITKKLSKEMDILTSKMIRSIMEELISE